MQAMVSRQRKELAAGSAGKNMFVLVARKMLAPGNHPKSLTNTNGGDIAKEF